MADAIKEPRPESVAPIIEVPPEATSLEADERVMEQLEEKPEKLPEKSPTVRPEPLVPGVPTVRPSLPQEKDEAQLKVEKILEEGLGPLYTGLPSDAKQKFKQKGEEAATEIAEMVRTLKLHISKVLRLIRDWLLIIPGVNKFFLEQEAKIKTDKIVELVKAKQEEMGNG